MGKTLSEIAQELEKNKKKVNLIYAFNGTGKTRLSKEFKNLVNPKHENETSELENKKILYYNAYTEDLFFWDNDLLNDSDVKLKIHPNSFTGWVFKEQGLDQSVIERFQNNTSKSLTPRFNSEFTDVSFSFERGNKEDKHNIKISKGEESNFIWSIFYSLFEQIIYVLNEPDVENRETSKFNQLEYVFIDDPVTSLDDNHLIQLAVDLSELIKSSTSELRFIITTHNPSFYNVIYNELNNPQCYMLEQLEDGTHELKDSKGDSNRSFSYHLLLKSILDDSISNNKIEKYHFTLLRNLYEKTASFLGTPKWIELLPDDKKLYYNRIIQFTSHSTLSGDVIAEPTPQEKETVKLLFEHLIKTYNFWKEEENV
ncbi:MAG: hypothetical protein ACRCUP_05305 [Mycoplasmatales bacterium]